MKIDISYCCFDIEIDNCCYYMPFLITIMGNSGFANETMVKIDNIIIVKTLDNTFNFPSLDLVYIVPCENGTVISPDCQQKLFSLEHDTGGRFLLVTFLGEH